MTTITLSTTLTSRPVIGNGGGGGIPPANTIAPVISGTGVVGQTLSCSTGTWTGIPAPTYTYQWLRGVSDIPGATSSTYTLVQADATFVITCQVTATNVAGSASVTSSNSLVIDDADAQAFITAANITNTTQQNAINTLVVDLKGYGVWSKMKAIYPFVGGTASTHKWNLKDPRDLDAAFRLVFNGGWTHSSTGATPNGTNGYANSYFNPNLLLTLSSANLSFYSRSTNVFSTSQCDMGVDETSLSTGFNLTQKINPISTTYHGRAYKQQLTGVDANNIAGLHIVNRNTLNSLKYFRNGNLIQTNTTTELGPIPNYNIFIGSLNQNNVAANFSNRETAFSSIGDGLTDTEAANLAITVESFQTTLGRSVNPWYNNGNLLLDDYPNAATAYSVRKLRNYYIGPCLRVRRSSDNAEQDIYFNPSGELDTTSLLSFVGAGNGFVTTWYDQSGNNRNATNSTAANQPQIVSSGVLDTKNGKPTLYFDGVNDVLSISTQVFNNSIQSVFSATEIGTDFGGIITAKISNFDNAYALGFGTSKAQLFGGGVLNGVSPTFVESTTTLNNSFKLIGGIYKTTNYKLVINGSVNATGTKQTANNVATTTEIGKYRVGDSNFGLMYISELNLWASDEESNLTPISSNIQTYFGI